MGPGYRRVLGLSQLAICGKKAQYFSTEVCYSFYAYDIQMNGRPEKFVFALKALQATKTMSPLV
jgi:hypothetical protein